MADLPTNYGAFSPMSSEPVCHQIRTHFTHEFSAIYHSFGAIIANNFGAFSSISSVPKCHQIRIHFTHNYSAIYHTFGSIIANNMKYINGICAKYLAIKAMETWMKSQRNWYQVIRN